MRTSRTLEAVPGCHGFANFYFTHSAVDQHRVKTEWMQLSMRIIALRFVSSITDSVHCTSYCKFSNKTVNIIIGINTGKQCASSRTGISCGACMDNFSLAIGSSRCIEYPNNHNLELLLAIAAAGIFLVLFWSLHSTLLLLIDKDSLMDSSASSHTAFEERVVSKATHWVDQ